MNYFYSNSTTGFYIEGLHADIPNDAVAITEAHYQALLDGQSQGQVIVTGENGQPQLITPPPAPEPVRDQIITNLAFDLRFTMQERIAIELASIDDPAAPMEQRTQAAALRVSQERSRKAQFTDLADQVTRAGVEQMEALGLLAQGRAAEILDAPIHPGERPGFGTGGA